ncbi:hypothetical protein OROGR_000927 [Orobanche gracilis]
MDVYFDDESAEVVISSLRLGDEQESGSLFTNSNWFAFEDEKTVDEHSSDPISSSTGSEYSIKEADDDDMVIEDLEGPAISEPPEEKPTLGANLITELYEGLRDSETSGSDKPHEWVEWRESSHSIEFPPGSNSVNTENADQEPSLPNGEAQVELGDPGAAGPPKCESGGGGLPASKEIEAGKTPSESTKEGEKAKKVGN